MFLALWNYLRGYVIIKVSGFSVERFVNLAAYKGIYLWDISPEGAHVKMKVGIKNFFKLRECAKKTGCKIKISERSGMPFKIKQCEKRKAYSIGVLLFVIAMYGLSSFVWTIEINGNDRVAKEAILQALKEEGFYPGKLKKKIDVIGISNKLLEKFPDDISWIAINIKGTDARVDLVETIEDTPIVNRSTPLDIVASKEGVIVSITASSGRPVVAVGDVVEKGDVLISKTVYLTDAGQVVGEQEVRSGGEVYAKVWYDLQAEALLEYEHISYEKETKTDRSLNFFEKNINVIRPKFDDDEFERTLFNEKYLAFGDFQIPIGIKTEEYKRIIKSVKQRDEEEAKALAEKSLLESITAIEVKSGGDAIDIKKDYVLEGNIFRITAKVGFLERIDEQASLDENERGNVDGADPEISGS